METIVLCYPAESRHVDLIRGVAPNMRIVASDERRIQNDILAAHIYCGHARLQLDWNRIVAEGRLRWIQSTAAGLDHCLHPAVIESDIIVSGASGLFAHAVAEQTLALLLGLLRRIPQFVRAQESRTYARKPTDDLRGKTVGIVGFGGNGQRIANVLSPFGLRIVATDCFHDQIQFPCVEVLADNQLDELFTQSNIVIVTLPLTRKTMNMIGRRQFEIMPPGGYLINVGRGQVIREEDLINALQNGHLTGAGLDVVATEPLPPLSPLWELDNVLITPHVGAQSAKRYDAVTKLFCENVHQFLSNKSLLNVVDKSLGFPRFADRISSQWVDTMK